MRPTSLDVTLVAAVAGLLSFVFFAPLAALPPPTPRSELFAGHPSAAPGAGALHVVRVHAPELAAFAAPVPRKRAWEARRPHVVHMSLCDRAASGRSRCVPVHFATRL